MKKLRRWFRQTFLVTKQTVGSPSWFDMNQKATHYIKPFTVWRVPQFSDLPEIANEGDHALVRHPYVILVYRNGIWTNYPKKGV